MKEAAADPIAIRELVIGVLIGLALAALVAGVLWATLRRKGARGPATPVPLAAAAPGAPHAAVAERLLLVDGVADLALRLPPGLDREAVDLLGRVGVRRRSADGLAFDPAWQDAVGSEPAPDPSRERTVLRTVRDFFDDRGRPATRPQVVVAVAPAPDAGSWPAGSA